MSREAAVLVDSVSKSFNGVKAVDSVSFRVREGEVFSLLGPNGAGKTTLLKMIVGVLPPDRGRVLVKGIDVWERPVEAKRLIGYVPQENILYDRLTGMENMLFYASLYDIPRGEAKRRARELLEAFGLAEAARRKVKEYSGGMRRRLSLAVSLIHDPLVLVLDEPTTGLDPAARRDMWRLIEGLRREGRTVVMATHYMEEADALSDTVAIMNEGRVLALGGPEELKRMYAQLTVIEVELASPSPRVVEALSAYSEEGRVLEKDGVVRVYVREYETSLPRIVEAVLKARGRPMRITIAEPTLEDVFLRLTGRVLSGEA